VLLHENPEQRALLQRDSSLIAKAIEEILRLEPPSPSGGRWLLSPVELHGTVMPAGSIVMLHTAAASRDDREYADPDRMDVTRAVRQLSFGHGIHLCVGALLARLEGKIALEETLTRFPTWTIDAASAQMRLSSGLRGWSTLPFTPG
jgi:cytochrome P450